jgi:hypothetical protein
VVSVVGVLDYQPVLELGELGVDRVTRLVGMVGACRGSESHDVVPVRDLSLANRFVA